MQSAGTEVLGNGGGAGTFAYKGGGNAVDAAVAAALTACVVNPGNCSLGGYGGHMLIYKSGCEGEPRLITCIDFNSAAGSLASSNMFLGSVDLTNGHWTGPLPAANLVGWKAAGVPGTFAGLYMAQTNYGRKVSGTNYFPFAEVLKPAMARIANGQAAGNAYYTLTSVSNLLMDLYTNSPGYTDAGGNPNPYSSNDPYGVFYCGGIARDIVAVMEANGGLVTYADLTNYRPREVAPYLRHFSPPNGTPAWVCVAPPGSAGVSVLQELAMIESLGWTNGPHGTWDSLRYWHSRAEATRLMWKDHFQWLGDPWSGVLPPDILGNGNTSFCDQLLAHVTKGYPYGCPWDPTEVRLTNSLAGAIIEAVADQTTIAISTDWDDIRYGTRNISTCDKWGNCVALTLSMGSGYGAQVAVTNRGLVLGQGMALFDARPGWPDSIAPGKRPVHNMCPVIVIPDQPGPATDGVLGGRPPLALGGVGGSTIENNVAMQLVQYLTEGSSSPSSAPLVWLYNFEGNNVVYMRPSYPAGVQSYLAGVGFSAPGGPPSAGEVSRVEAWIAPMLLSQPVSQDVSAGTTVFFAATASGLPVFYQWLRNGAPLSDGPTVSGAQTPLLTVANVAMGGGYSLVVTNGAGSVTSVLASLTIDGAPAIVRQPSSLARFPGTMATFRVSAIGTGPLSYEWRKDGTNLTDGGKILGVNSTQLSIGPVSNAEAGAYSVVVTSPGGSVVSESAALAVVNPSSGLILYEPFAYANVGGPVSSNTPGNWTYGGSGANDLSVVAGNLSWPGLVAPAGCSVTNGGGGLGVRRLFGAQFNTGQVYFSALFRINDLGFGSWNGQATMAGGLAATNNTSFRLQVLVKSNSPAGYVFGTQKSGTGATASFDTTEHRAGETVFLAGKYDFAASPNTVTLWINPAPATFGADEPASGGITANTGEDGFVIDRFNMRQNTPASVPAGMQWDELRFGVSWSAVTPPLPSSPPARAEMTGVVKPPGGAFHFTYGCNDERSYLVFASTNLVDWEAVGTATESYPGWFQFADLSGTNSPQRFYQLRAP